MFGLRLHSRLLSAQAAWAVGSGFLSHEWRFGRWRRPVTALGHLRAGLTSDRIALYGRAAAPRLYWSDLDRMRASRLNGDYGTLLSRKEVCHRLLARLGGGPAILGAIHGGRFVPERGASARPVLEALAELPETTCLLRRFDPGARGPLARLARDGDGWRLGAAPMSTRALAERLGQGWWILLADPAAGDEGGPRLQLTTLPCPETARPFCAFATTAFATEAGPQAPPFHAPVDLVTGEVKAAALPAPGEPPGEPVRPYKTHPETGAPIQGARIPSWSVARDLVEATAAALPTIRAATWTLMPAGTGHALIDAQNDLAIVEFQIHAPLLADERIRRSHAALFGRPT
jgi:hypothetical protein